MLQAITGDVFEAYHRITNLDFATRTAGVIGRKHLHLRAEAQPANGLCTVHLDRLAVRLGDDFHHGQRARANLASVLAQLWTHVDAASDALQRARMHQPRECFINRRTGADLREHCAGKGSTLLHVLDSIRNSFCDGHKSLKRSEEIQIFPDRYDYYKAYTACFPADQQAQYK